MLGLQLLCGQTPWGVQHGQWALEVRCAMCTPSPPDSQTSGAGQFQPAKNISSHPYNGSIRWQLHSHSKQCFLMLLQQRLLH